jgi:PEP-CTERM motif
VNDTYKFYEFVVFNRPGNHDSDNVLLGSVSGVTAAVPEPATWGMMLLGFVGLGFAFRQSRRKVSFA